MLKATVTAGTAQQSGYQFDYTKWTADKGLPTKVVTSMKNNGQAAATAGATSPVSVMLTVIDPQNPAPWPQTPQPTQTTTGTSMTLTAPTLTK
jgi:hypothetical protein